MFLTQSHIEWNVEVGGYVPQSSCLLREITAHL